MKQIVSDHAVAIGSPFLYEGNDGIEQTEMQMYQCGNTGLLFAIDGAWLEDQADDVPLVIPSFADEGTAIVLVDNANEVNENLKAVGEDHPESVIDEVITAMKEDIEKGDWTAIAELFNFIPRNVLDNYLG
jgi:hypothetical protein